MYHYHRSLSFHQGNSGNRLSLLIPVFFWFFSNYFFVFHYIALRFSKPALYTFLRQCRNPDALFTTSTFSSLHVQFSSSSVLLQSRSRSPPLLYAPFLISKIRCKKEEVRRSLVMWQLEERETASPEGRSCSSSPSIILTHIKCRRQLPASLNLRWVLFMIMMIWMYDCLFVWLMVQVCIMNSSSLINV